MGVPISRQVFRDEPFPTAFTSSLEGVRRLAKAKNRCNRLFRIFLVRIRVAVDRTFHRLFTVGTSEEEQRNAKRCSALAVVDVDDDRATTAFTPLHPRNEPPSSKERPYSRGMRRQNQYTVVPPPPGGNARAQTTLECLAFAYPSLPTLSRPRGKRMRRSDSDKHMRFCRSPSTECSAARGRDDRRRLSGLVSWSVRMTYCQKARSTFHNGNTNLFNARCRKYSSSQIIRYL